MLLFIAIWKLEKNYKRGSAFVSCHIYTFQGESMFWVNGSAFTYELSGCGFESFCNHLMLDILPVSSKGFFDI